MTPNAVTTPTPVQAQTPSAAPSARPESKYAPAMDNRAAGTPAPSATPTLRTETPGCGEQSADRSIPLVDEKKPVEAPKA